jgi:pimeloyl-ACP methyl ester carboxylesterase
MGALAAGAGVTIAGAVLAGRRAEQRWRAADRADGAVDPAERLLPAGRSLTVTTDDGAELAGSDVGPADGPTVVLAHCWMCSREVWAPVANRLVRAGRRVVLYDQRGHGSSTVGSEGYTIPRLGADLRAVLEAVDARDAVVGGHSMGGMTVMSLASYHAEVVTERARGLVLVATAASGLGRGGRADDIAVRVMASGMVERALRSPFGHALVRSSVGRTARHSDLKLTRELVAACPPASRHGWMKAILAMDLRAGLAGIDVPVAVLVGTHDLLTPPDRAAELVDAIAGAKLITLDGMGHMLPLEAPDEVAEAILSL